MGEHRTAQYDSSTEGSILPRRAETSSVHRHSKKPLLEAPSTGKYEWLPGTQLELDSHWYIHTSLLKVPSLVWLSTVNIL